MLRQFIEEKCGRPRTALERVQQNYISAAYIQSKFAARRGDSNRQMKASFLQSRKTKQQPAESVQIPDPTRDKLVKQNERMGSIVIQEKEKRKQIENDMGLMRLAFQSLQNVNAKLSQKLATEGDEQFSEPIIPENCPPNEQVVRIKKVKSRRITTVSVAVQVEQNELVPSQQKLRMLQLEKQNADLKQQKCRLEKTMEFLYGKLDENTTTMKKAVARERHSIQSLRSFSKEVGLTDNKVSTFLKDSAAVKEFELGGVDASTSQVFRENILYLIYLMNNQRAVHEKEVAELHQQLQLETSMKQKFQQNIHICRETYKLIKEQLTNPMGDSPASLKRELLRITTPLQYI